MCILTLYSAPGDTHGRYGHDDAREGLHRACKASQFLRLASQFLRRLARRPFAHPYPPLFDRDSASLEMQYLRSPEMHTTRIGAATMTFWEDGARTVTFLRLRN